MMENFKNKLNIFLVCLTVFCSIFLVGMKDVNALSSQNDFSNESEQKLFVSSLTEDNYKDVLSRYDYMAFNVSRTTSDFYPTTYKYVCYLVVPSVVKDAFYGNLYGGDSSRFTVSCGGVSGMHPFVIYVGTQEFRDTVYPYFHSGVGFPVGIIDKTSVINSTFDIKDANGNIVFRQPLVKAAEQLFPVVEGETKTILVVVVGFLGLWILLWILSKRFKVFFLG